MKTLFLAICLIAAGNIQAAKPDIQYCQCIGIGIEEADRIDKPRIAADITTYKERDNRVQPAEDRGFWPMLVQRINMLWFYFKVMM